jgi:hypothetical protein
VLERTTVDVLRAYGRADRLDREGHVHDSMRIVWAPVAKAASSTYTGTSANALEPTATDKQRFRKISCCATSNAEVLTKSTRSSGDDLDIWVTFSLHHAQVALAEQYAGLPTEEAA